MNRRSFITASASVAFPAAVAQASADAVAQRPDQRLARRYRFQDPDMDLFFMAAMGWGATGGLDIGQAHYVASMIRDGDPDSWVQSFSEHGDRQNLLADTWLARGWRRAAGEARLQAFAAYRSAWQFAGPGEVFLSCYGKHKAAFARAMDELGLPATGFEVPYGNQSLPGVHFRASPEAPLVLVIGGADTCFEDLFLTVGRNLLDRGYAVALVDLPGQGKTPVDGLYWQADAELPIAAVIDVLVTKFGARPGQMALLGLSLGGYFVARAAAVEKRVATVMASSPFPDPAQLFRFTAAAATARGTSQRSLVSMRSTATSLWKAGARTPGEFLQLTAGMVADPAAVTVPFLSIVGSGDSPVFVAQARQWHGAIASTRKSLVELDAASGADAHVQVANRLRLAQETAGWMDDIFARAEGGRGRSGQTAIGRAAPG